jgi:uncharacterized protein with NRDE domain
MCLILAARRAPDYTLIVAANRDEFYDRPTAPAAFFRRHVSLAKTRAPH